MRVKAVWLLIGAVVSAAAVGIASCDKATKSEIPAYDEATKGNISAYDGKSGAKLGDVCINPKDGAEMVWVPAGDFLMGTTDEEIAELLKEHPKWKAEWFAAEKPQRKVHLDGYWIYKHEVTVAQYRTFCEATKRKMPKAPKWGWKDDHPVVNVSWRDAADYAKWAGARLPTEAEWEKATRGADGRRYPWGKEWPPPKGAGNFADKSLAKEDPDLAKELSEVDFPVLADYDDGYAYTAPVGSYPAGASPCGALDMAGNVWEWCADWYGEDYYKSAPSNNPRGPESGDGRVGRGGGWDYAGSNYRCANRYYYHSNNRDSGLGFRLSRSGG